MASVILIGSERNIATQISETLAIERHWVQERPHVAEIRDLMGAHIVLAGGSPRGYLDLLRRVRENRPSLPFVVVTPVPDTKAWLDALEAGATDYFSVPLEKRHLNWLMEHFQPASWCTLGNPPVPGS